MKRNVPYRIVHEDDSLVVVDKTAGIAVLADRWDDSRERLDEILNEMYAAEVAEGKAERIPFPHRDFRGPPYRSGHLGARGLRENRRSAPFLFHSL
jgi:hypothetical protein